MQPISVDTSGTENVAGMVPTVCPECQRPFSRVIKPKRELQGRAKVLLGVGILSSLMLAPIVYLGFYLVLTAPEMRIPFGLLIAGLGTILISCIPVYIFGVWALRIPRIVRLSCGQCQWQDTMLVNSSGRVVTN